MGIHYCPVRSFVRRLCSQRAGSELVCFAFLVCLVSYPLQPYGAVRKLVRLSNGICVTRLLACVIDVFHVCATWDASAALQVRCSRTTVHSSHGREAHPWCPKGELLSVIITAAGTWEPSNRAVLILTVHSTYGTKSHPWCPTGAPPLMCTPNRFLQPCMPAMHACTAHAMQQCMHAYAWSAPYKSSACI